MSPVATLLFLPDGSGCSHPVAQLTCVLGISLLLMQKPISKGPWKVELRL